MATTTTWGYESRNERSTDGKVLNKLHQLIVLEGDEGKDFRRSRSHSIGHMLSKILTKQPSQVGFNSKS